MPEYTAVPGPAPQWYALLRCSGRLANSSRNRVDQWPPAGFPRRASRSLSSAARLDTGRRPRSMPPLSTSWHRAGRPTFGCTRPPAGCTSPVGDRPTGRLDEEDQARLASVRRDSPPPRLWTGPLGDERARAPRRAVASPPGMAHGDQAECPPQAAISDQPSVPRSHPYQPARSRSPPRPCSSCPSRSRNETIAPSTARFPRRIIVLSPRTWGCTVPVHIPAGRRGLIPHGPMCSSSLARIGEKCQHHPCSARAALVNMHSPQRSARGDSDSLAVTACPPLAPTP